ncbi:hypothetical protein PA598K_04617 [Paenibacillus sp. 598K]|uniref:energy-coupling factor transporter transmembrane component T family protein n=1 Tax=Paenibacillus sp. 598K TaxID=1117987 RepID=UPI000FF9DF58|nr:energy-coupling factor transporter transmembrane protein EcfT [Paenibacillus sp. 598K]GBF76169.1 hypothetical protein PA598K_04617 [Paenibacillus sp. 598K]
MRQRMMIGRYIAGDSWMHGLDPRAKIVAMPLFMIAVFLVDGYIAAGALLLFTVALLRFSGIGLRPFARAVRPLLFLLLFIFLFHLLFSPGGSKWLQLGSFALYSGGLERGIVAAGRMVLFIVFAAALTFTTPPDQLAQGLGSVLSPLRRLRVPTDRLALMLGIALRFVPTLFDEAERIWRAQVSRGLDLRSGSLLRRARLLIALLIPVCAGAIRRALALADAMESRGYRIGAPRTSYRTFGWGAADTGFVLLLLVPIVAVAFV